MMRKSRKSYIAKLVSLVLCATACLTFGVASLIKTNKAQAESVDEINEMYTLSGFTIDEKAEVRKEDPFGIRFITNVSEEKQAEIANLLGAGNIEYGTLILPADFLAGGELTHNTPSVVDARVGAVDGGNWSSATKYTAVLGGKKGEGDQKLNLSTSYANRPLVARSYAINTDTGVVYYTENTALRSIGYVTYKAVANGDEGDALTEMLKATKMELVFNENVSVYNSENTGMDVIANGVKNQSDNVFAFKVGGIIDESVTIAYTTTDESIISVDGERLTAKGEGMATITATVTVNGIKYDASQILTTAHYAPSSEYTILLPADAGTYEIEAANKLRSVLQEATGIRLALVTESGTETTSGRYISIGETKLVSACSISDLKAETACRVKKVNNTVFIRGVIERATLYGVQQLLEDTVGYEYYMENSYKVDKKTEFVIAEKDYVPAIEHEVMQQMNDKEISGEHAAPSYTDFIVPVGADNHQGVSHNSILTIKAVDNAGVTNTSRSYSSSGLKYKDWYATTGNYFHRDSNNYKLELCYTAHGNTSDGTSRADLVETIATAMFNQMQSEEFKDYDRIAFSHGDHNYWCECTTCNNEGNPSDNMLHFILDVAANLKVKLQNAKDDRADTFKICSLFYNATNLAPKNTEDYQSALTYMPHVEIWFAETGIDFVLPITDTTRKWNVGAKEQFDAWATFANSKGADMLWWGYYSNVRSGFIPYDSFDALRGNYAYANSIGVDYMFNQAIGYNFNWTRLKQYLMSELRWNANPGDDTWNGWISDYMEGAFGQGATAMNEYFTAWRAWAAANQANFKNSQSTYLTSGSTASAKSTYASKRGSMTTSISYDARSSTLMSLDTLKGWLASCNKALAALDVNDANYQTYYNNIVLERLTPLYLIMYIHGKFEEVVTSYIPYTKEWKFSTPANVTPYAQDFLDGIELWGITYDGEGAYNKLPTMKTAMESLLKSITEYKVTERQNVIAGTSITLNDANITSGTYTATLSGPKTITATVTAADGSATLALSEAPVAGTSYAITLRSDTRAITFNNVLFITQEISTFAQLQALTKGSKSGYYLLTSDIEDNTLVNASRAAFTGVLDGNGHTISKLNIGANGLFTSMTGATVKNLTLTNVTASAVIFTKTATNTTFENVKISIQDVVDKPLATTATGVTYKNVSMSHIKGEVIDKTFYIAVGENQVVIEDKERLAKGTYTVTVGGDSYNTEVFKTGQLVAKISALDVGETINVICDNSKSGTAFVYKVMRITKFIKTFDELVELGVGGAASKTPGNDVYGYYVLAKDLDGKGALITHGYNYNQSHFQGVIDGNGYTVNNFTVGQCGILGGVKNATIKNINFESVNSYTKSDEAGHNYAGLIAGNAENVVLENISVRFFSYEASPTYTPPNYIYKGLLIGERSNNVTYRNIYIDLSRCSTQFVVDSNATIFGSSVNGLVCEDVTVYVRGIAENDICLGYSDKNQTLISKPAGLTIDVNDEKLIVINQGNTSTIMPYYIGDETSLGFAEDTIVQEMVTQDLAENTLWYEKANAHRQNVLAKIAHDAAQTVLSVEFVLSEEISSGNVFYVWGTKGQYDAFGSVGITSSAEGVTGNGFKARIYGKGGTAVTKLEANVIYVLKMYMEGASSFAVANIADSGMTTYFSTSSITYSSGELPAYTQLSMQGNGANTSLGIYDGDETAVGFDKGTLVLENKAQGKTWEDGVRITTDSSTKCLTVRFAYSSVPSGQQFMIYMSGAETGFIARISDGEVWHDTGDPYYREVELLDAEGNPVTDLEANVVYTLKIYHGGATAVILCPIGDNYSIYYDNNIVQNNNVYYELPEYAPTYSTDGGHTNETLPRYTGNETAYGFAEGTYVFEAAMTTAWYDRAVFNVDSTQYDYMDVDFVVVSDSNQWWFNAWVVNSSGMLDGNYILNENSGFATHHPNTGASGGKTRIQVFDADGNVVTGARSAGVKYTVRVYLSDESLTQVQFGQDNVTMLFANVSFGTEKPTEVVYNGSGEELPRFEGDNSTIGFTAKDYVFEQVTTDTWDHRAVLGNDSKADFLVFDFSINNPSNMTIWFTRNKSVVAGYSNILTNTAYVAAGECAVRTIYVFDENGNAATAIAANKKYTMWVKLGGEEQFGGAGIGNANATIYYANLRYVYGVGDNILRQYDANALLPQYVGNVTSLGFEAGTYVQSLVGTGNADHSWTENIYSNRARITANGEQDYISVEFVSTMDVDNAKDLFHIWPSSGASAVKPDGSCTTALDAIKVSIVDEDGIAPYSSIVAGKKYTLRVYDVGATSLAIGVYGVNTVHFANVTYGTGEPKEEHKTLVDGNGALNFFEGDVTTLGFEKGEFVQQMVTEAATNVWNGTRQNLATDILTTVGQYVSIKFSLNVDFTSSEGDLFFVWCRNGEAWPTNFYVSLTPSANACIFDMNGNKVTDKLTANTAYVLELYAADVDRHQVANINSKAITVSFATKSVKTYATSLASSPITGSKTNAVSICYNEQLGFDKNEVVKCLETETVSNVWGDVQANSGFARPSWLIKVASAAGKVAKIRFALSKDFNAATSMLFYVWAYSDHSGTCPANGSVSLSGSSAMTAIITDEAGNAVTSLKANQVYELSLYCATAIKYDVANMVAEGMFTYVSNEVTYTDYAG